MPTVHQKPIVAVFCGSKSGSDPSYIADASLLGKLLALKGFNIVYGGSSKGMMGALANNAIEHGAQVIGVIPEVLLAWEQQHSGLTELIVTKDMHIRKKTMYETCDAAIILPGGFGTLDELFEMLTWNQLSIHDKKIHLLNTEGFYDHLINHVKMLEEKGFLYDPIWTRLTHHKNPEDLVHSLNNQLNKD
jgi:uncharacterized protein (TIGR00730 family)